MKLLGVAIWCVAFAMFAAQLFQAEVSDAHIFFMGIALFAYLPLLLYSWLWGAQRGHVVHFLLIVIAAWLSVVLYFRDSMPTLLLGLGVGAPLLAGYILLRRYRPGFVSDYKRRIKRDHFAHKE
jgi:hypothetical protein